jgi:hypothetical protein
MLLESAATTVAKNLNIAEMRKRARPDEQIVLCVSLPGRTEIAISNHFFDPGAQSRGLGGFSRIEKA